MRTIKLIWLIAVCMATIKAQGQNFKKLKPGEMVPEAAFTILKDGKYQPAKLSDYKGKLLILDYWNIWCSSCIEAFPKLTALQREFGDRVTILPVSFINTKDQIFEFVKRRRATKAAVELPLGIFESTDNPLFKSVPTVGYPCEVWIDQTGKFLRASYASDVTKDNIELILAGKQPSLKSRNSQMNFRATRPLLINNNGGPDTAFSYRSLITGFIDSLGGAPADHSFAINMLHFLYGNRTLIDLLKISVKKGISNDPYNQWVVLEGSSEFKERLLPDLDVFNSRNWREANSYCYDLILPVTFTKKEAYQIMLQNLEAYFRLSVAIEHRMMKCFVLKRIDSEDRLKTTGKPPVNILEDGRLVIRNMKTETLLDFLNVKDAPIMIDETGYDDKIDVSIKVDATFEVDFLNQQLKKYGLKLEHAKRELLVVVIKEKV